MLSACDSRGMLLWFSIQLVGEARKILVYGKRAQRVRLLIHFFMFVALFLPWTHTTIGYIQPLHVFIGGAHEFSFLKPQMIKLFPEPRNHAVQMGYFLQTLPTTFQRDTLVVSSFVLCVVTLYSLHQYNGTGWIQKIVAGAVFGAFVWVLSINQMTLNAGLMVYLFGYLLELIGEMWLAKDHETLDPFQVIKEHED